MLRIVSQIVNPQDTPLRGSSTDSGTKGSRSGVDLVSDAAKRALTPAEATKLLEEFRHLCRMKGEDIRALEDAAEKLRRAGYKQELGQALRDAVASPEANPHVGGIWMRRLVGSNSWDRRYPHGLDQLCARGEIGHRAVIEFLEIMGAKRRARLVIKAVRRHRAWLRKHPRGWAVAARAFINVRCYRAAYRWMADWRTRSELDSPTLYCLAHALRGVGRDKEAHEVISLALARPGAEQLYPALKVWHLMEDALSGNTAAAAAQFKELKPLGWDDDLLCRYYLARGVIRVQQAEGRVRNEAFAAATARIKDHFRRIRVYRTDLLLRREYRRCFWRMSRDAGRPVQGILASWRSADNGWLLLPLLLVPGLQLFAPVYLYRFCTWRKGHLR